MSEWNPQISKSIVESWGFPDEIVESTDPEAYAHPEEDAEPSLLDVMVVAVQLLENDGDDDFSKYAGDSSWLRLGMYNAEAADVLQRYEQKLETVKQSLA